MRELSLLVSVVLCLPTLARAQTKETIIPAGSLLECTLEEPNFSSASAEVGDPVICHTRGVQEFGRAVFARGAYLAGHLAESREAPVASGTSTSSIKQRRPRPARRQ